MLNVLYVEGLSLRTTDRHSSYERDPGDASLGRLRTSGVTPSTSASGRITGMGNLAGIGGTRLQPVGHRALDSLVHTRRKPKHVPILSRICAHRSSTLATELNGSPRQFTPTLPPAAA